MSPVSLISRSTFLACLFVLLLAPLASAQIELSGGYSNLHLGGSDQNLRDADGFGVDLRVGGPIIPLPVVNSFRLGVDLGWRRYNTDGSGTSIFTPDKSDLDLFAGELRAPPAGHARGGLHPRRPEPRGGLGPVDAHEVRR